MEVCDICGDRITPCEVQIKLHPTGGYESKGMRMHFCEKHMKHLSEAGVVDIVRKVIRDSFAKEKNEQRKS